MKKILLGFLFLLSASMFSNNSSIYDFFKDESGENLKVVKGYDVEILLDKGWIEKDNNLILFKNEKGKTVVIVYIKKEGIIDGVYIPKSFKGNTGVLADYMNANLNSKVFDFNKFKIEYLKGCFESNFKSGEPKF
jgi:hypothetical protein